MAVIILMHTDRADAAAVIIMWPNFVLYGCSALVLRAIDFKVG